jgi:Family of unknown function (DUF6789)
MKPQALLKALLAGIAATVPMTMAMELGRRSGLLRRLPPEEITDQLLAFAGTNATTHRDREKITGLVHVATGATLGVIFAALPQPKRLTQRIGLNATYGLGIYALNYVGLAPMARLMPPPTQDRPGRQLTTLAAHLVFGATLGCLLGPDSTEVSPLRVSSRACGG